MNSGKIFKFVMRYSHLFYHKISLYPLLAVLIVISISAQEKTIFDISIPPDVGEIKVSRNAEGVELNWKNPQDASFVGVIIIRKVKEPIQLFLDGKIVYKGPATSFFDKLKNENISNNENVYYRIVSYSKSMFYSDGVTAKADAFLKNQYTFYLEDASPARYSMMREFAALAQRNAIETETTPSIEYSFERVKTNTNGMAALNLDYFWFLANVPLAESQNPISGTEISASLHPVFIQAIALKGDSNSSISDFSGSKVCVGEKGGTNHRSAEVLFYIQGINFQAKISPVFGSYSDALNSLLNKDCRLFIYSGILPEPMLSSEDLVGKLKLIPLVLPERDTRLYGWPYFQYSIAPNTYQWNSTEVASIGTFHVAVTSKKLQATARQQLFHLLNDAKGKIQILNPNWPPFSSQQILLKDTFQKYLSPEQLDFLQRNSKSPKQ